MKLDILVLAAHPDDAELGCGGTIVKHTAAGKKVGVVDFTKGELGTRGTPELRSKEAAASAKILGLSVRENLCMRDGFFKNDEESQLLLIQSIRRFQPEIVIANATYDRHIDHGKAAELAHDACFLSGLEKIVTYDDQTKQGPWRPKALYHYIQSQYLEPDFIVDISGYWDKKMEAIMAFGSQFYTAGSTEPETYISKPGFLKMLEARAVEFGHAIGATHGEGFNVRRFPGVKNLFDLM